MSTVSRSASLGCRSTHAQCSPSLSVEETRRYPIPDTGPKRSKIPVSVLRSLVACSAADLKRHVAVLEHFELLYLDDDPFDGPLST